MFEISTYAMVAKLRDDASFSAGGDENVCGRPAKSCALANDQGSKC